MYVHHVVWCPPSDHHNQCTRYGVPRTTHSVASAAAHSVAHSQRHAAHTPRTQPAPSPAGGIVLIPRAWDAAEFRGGRTWVHTRHTTPCRARHYAHTHSRACDLTRSAPSTGTTSVRARRRGEAPHPHPQHHVCAVSAASHCCVQRGTCRTAHGMRHCVQPPEGSPLLVAVGDAGAVPRARGAMCMCERTHTAAGGPHAGTATPGPWCACRSCRAPRLSREGSA